MLEEVAMFDRLQTDSQRRLLELVQSLAQVSHGLSVLKPYHESILASFWIVNVPVEERWHSGHGTLAPATEGRNRDVPDQDSGRNDADSRPNW